MEYSVIAMYPEEIYSSNLSPVNKRERPAGVQRLLSKILELSVKFCNLFMNKNRILSLDEHINSNVKD